VPWGRVKCIPKSETLNSFSGLPPWWQTLPALPFEKFTKGVYISAITPSLKKTCQVKTEKNMRMSV
jgi:hypothetical protein